MLSREYDKRGLKQFLSSSKQKIVFDLKNVRKGSSCQAREIKLFTLNREGRLHDVLGPIPNLEVYLQRSHRGH